MARWDKIWQPYQRSGGTGCSATGGSGGPLVSATDGLGGLLTLPAMAVAAG